MRVSECVDTWAVPYSFIDDMAKTACLVKEAASVVRLLDTGKTATSLLQDANRFAENNGEVRDHGQNFFQDFEERNYIAFDLGFVYDLEQVVRELRHAAQVQRSALAASRSQAGNADIAVLAAEVEALNQKVGQPNTSAKRGKKSHGSGDAKIRIISTLTEHHQYRAGRTASNVEDRRPALASCLNYEPIANNELARRAECSKSTASKFFKDRFGGYSEYVQACRSGDNLVTVLVVLNDDLSTTYLLSPDHSERSSDDDE